MFNILVVEDDTSTRKLMEAVLKENGYRPYLAENGLEALDVLDRQQVDLIVLDVMMPKMDGFALTETLRENGSELPILMVTAKETQQDKRQGFLVGTDDYMVKPVDEEEMLLRIRALLRRAQIVSERMLTIGEVTLSYDALTVTRGEDTVTLPQKEFYLLYKLLAYPGRIFTRMQLLYKLLAYPGRIFTRMQLMDEIWGMDSQTDDRTLNVHINRLRDRFGDYPEFDIVTVRGLGYKAVKHV